MRRLSFRLGLLISGLLGIILALSSLLIIKIEQCGFLQIGPSLLCGGYGAGYPLRFLQTDSDFPFTGMAGIQDLSLLLFFIDAVLWTIPLLLIFALTNYRLQQRIQGSAKRIWATTLLLLTPVWIQIISAIAEWINIPAPKSIYVVLNFFRIDLVLFLIGMSFPDQALEFARLFIIIAHIIIIGFVAAILSIPHTSLRSLRFLPYPLVAISSICISGWLTSMAAEPSASDIQSYPFRVDTLKLDNTASISQLSYQISFIRLPQTNIVYTINYYASESIFLEDQRNLKLSHRIDSLKQVDGKIYQLVSEAGQSDQQFVADAITDGTIDLSPNNPPRYLFVMISEQQEAGRPAQGYAYSIPIPQP